MQIETSRFGTVEIDEAGVITFPEGLPGFESHTRFVFMPHRMADPGKTSPFLWFQSLDDGKLAFLITNPRLFFPDYDPVIGTGDRQAIGAGENSEIHVYSLLTVPAGNPAAITANLLAPVVIDIANLMGRQVIVNDDRYGLRHRLIPEDNAPARQAEPAPAIISRSMPEPAKCAA